METLRTVPETGRAVSEARQVSTQWYEKNHGPECVWSAKPIADLAMLHVDHLIPFSAGKNNHRSKSLAQEKILIFSCFRSYDSEAFSSLKSDDFRQVEERLCVLLLSRV